MAKQSQSSYHFKDESFGQMFLHSLSNLRRDCSYTDVVLRVQDTELACHKVVLASASSYFHAMFTSGLEESCSNIVEIKSTDASTLKSMIDYIYSAEIDITTDNVQNLVQASDQFNFEGLKEACQQFMVDQVDPINCIGLHRFAKVYSLKTLSDGARNTMLTAFKQVVDGTEFNELTEDELIDYIDDDALDIQTEDSVFHALLTWTRTNIEQREASFQRVIKHVRLPHCTGAYLCHVVSLEPLMLSETGQKLMAEARIYHMLPDCKHELDSSRVLPRRSFHDCRRLVIVGGLTKHDKENRYCWYFFPKSSSWEHLAQLPRPNWKFYSVCVLQQGIVITGGYHANVKKDCWLFDLTEKKWRPLTSMTDGRCKHRAVVHSNMIYVIGGEDDMDKPLSSVEVYDMKGKEWRPIKNMLKSLSDPLVATYGHELFVFGGIEGDDTTSTSSQVYDTVWSEWRMCKDMPETCRLGAVATVNDRIFIVGGYTKSCMAYAPKLDIWSILSPPHQKHGNAPAVVWRGLILVGGGDVDTNETTSVIEAYNPENDSWSFWNVPLKEELSCHYMVNVELFGV